MNTRGEGRGIALFNLPVMKPEVSTVNKGPTSTALRIHLVNILNVIELSSCFAIGPTS